MKIKLLLAAAAVICTTSAFAAGNYPYKCPAVNQLPNSLAASQTFSANGIRWMNYHGAPFSSKDRASIQSFNSVNLSYPNPSLSCVYGMNDGASAVFLAEPNNVEFSLNPDQFTLIKYKGGHIGGYCDYSRNHGDVSNCTFGPAK